MQFFLCFVEIGSDILIVGLSPLLFALGFLTMFLIGGINFITGEGNTSGDRVRTRNLNPRGHTRLPRYARDKTGVIERVHGAFVFPDTNAHGAGEHPQWLYTVRFSGPELWGEEADPTIAVSVDAWESYLEPA